MCVSLKGRFKYSIETTRMCTVNCLRFIHTHTYTYVRSIDARSHNRFQSRTIVEISQSSLFHVDSCRERRNPRETTRQRNEDGKRVSGMRAAPTNVITYAYMYIYMYVRAAMTGHSVSASFRPFDIYEHTSMRNMCTYIHVRTYLCY